jgi:hypothetical protein
MLDQSSGVKRASTTSTSASPEPTSAISHVVRGMLEEQGRNLPPEEEIMLQRFAMVLSAAGLAMTVACSQSDPGITTAVKTKLAADDTVKAYEINVDTTNHVVTLTGNVDSAAAKDQANHHRAPDQRA